MDAVLLTLQVDIFDIKTKVVKTFSLKLQVEVLNREVERGNVVQVSEESNLYITNERNGASDGKRSAN